MKVIIGITYFPWLIQTNFTISFARRFRPLFTCMPFLENELENPQHEELLKISNYCTFLTQNLPREGQIEEILHFHLFE